MSWVINFEIGTIVFSRILFSKELRLKQMKLIFVIVKVHYVVPLRLLLCLSCCTTTQLIQNQGFEWIPNLADVIFHAQTSLCLVGISFLWQLAKLLWKCADGYVIGFDNLHWIHLWWWVYVLIYKLRLLYCHEDTTKWILSVIYILHLSHQFFTSNYISSFYRYKDI